MTKFRVNPAYCFDYLRMKNNDQFNFACRLKILGMLFLIVTIVFCSQEEKPEHKVIVVHARGVTYQDIINHLNGITREGFFSRNNAKGWLKKLQPITNAVTASNLASFHTGTYPSQHGIVGHSFGIREGDSLYQVSGFSQHFATEAFWEKAEKRGKSVLRIGSLVLHGKFENHTNVDCMAQGNQSGSAQILHLIPGAISGSQSLIKYFPLNGTSKFQLIPEYSDSVTVYMIKKRNGDDELIIDKDYNSANGVLGKMTKGAWLELTEDGNSKLPEAFRIKWVSSSIDTLELYIRPKYSNRGYPDHFVKRMESEIGPSKGWPNIPFFTSNRITDATLIEEIYAELDYVMDLFSLASQKKEYDLITLDYPLMDRLGHCFLEQSKSSTIQQYYLDAFNRMNRDFDRIEKFARQYGYDLIITSGHGFSPIHTSLDLNNFLNEHGINTDINDRAWQVRAIPGKVSAHLYLNGNFSTTDKENILTQIYRALEDLHHPTLEIPVVDDLYKKTALNEIGLDHPNAGDLFLLLNPGYVFGNHENEVFTIPTFKGDHGYSLKHEESFGILISNFPCEPCKSIDIAKIVESIMKLK